MKYSKLFYRNMLYYKTSYLTVVFGILISFMVLAGSLTVGDSVRYSLSKIAGNRTGKTEFAVIKNSGFFSEQLLQNLSSIHKINASSVLSLNGFAVKDGGKIRKNRIAVSGVKQNFFDFAANNNRFNFTCTKNEAVINRKLAAEMNLKPGDSLMVKLYSKGFISDELSITDSRNKIIPLHIIIKDIVDSEDFGKFGLNSHQQAPLNIFIPYQFLALKTGLDGYSNLILTAGKKGENLSYSKLGKMVQSSLTPADLQLTIQKTDNAIDIKSKSIFIKPAISAGLNRALDNPETIFTYFVNSIESKNKQTPYSFVTGSSRMTSFYNLQKDEIAVNRWLAEDLNLEPGSKVVLSWFVFDSFRKLKEETGEFNVISVINNDKIDASKSLSPVIPGLSESDDCRSWKSGLPIDLNAIREKDEQYWEQYNAAPKAFIHFETAQKLWKNSSGDLTSIRVSGQQLTVQDIAKKIQKALTPEIAGIEIRDLKKDNANSVNESQDFGVLFVSLSFFLILSSFILTSLFFMLLIRKRVSETGTLMALGFSSRQIYKIFMTEGIIISLFGGIFGTMAGILFNYAVIQLLGSAWHGSVGKTSIYFSFSFQTLLYGFVAGVVVSLIMLFNVLRKNLKTKIKDLHSDIFYKPSRRKTVLSLKLLASALVAVLIGITSYALVSSQASKDVSVLFFLGGFMVLAVFGLLFYLVLCFFEKPLSQGNDSFFQTSLIRIGLTNCSRAKLSSMSVFITLSCGLFLVISICTFTISPVSDTRRRDTGTGGFAFIVETSVPVHSDLNVEKNKRKYSLTDSRFKDLKFVPIKTTNGSDASCLNLNRSQNPVIAGVDASSLSARNAFKFAGNKFGLATSAEIWNALESNSDSNIVPAAADLNTIMWGLGRKPGDVISVVGESGEEFKLRLAASLANSVLQGKIIVSQNHFEKMFPGISGARYLLVDGPDDADLQKDITYALRDLGADVISAKARLFEFSTVQNTYLSIFQIIGGLGLVIGILSLGTVMFKSIHDRKKEFAVLQSFGFSRKKIRSLLFIEFGFLFIAGISAGVFSAFYAVIPSIISLQYQLPIKLIMFFIVVITIFGFLSILISVHKGVAKKNTAQVISQ